MVVTITLYKVFITFESVDEFQRYDHSNETASAELSHSTTYVVKIPTFESVNEILWCYHSTKTFEGVIPRYYLYGKKVLTIESVNEILWCYQSHESSSQVLSNGTNDNFQL